VPPSQQVFETWIAGLTEAINTIRYSNLNDPVPLPDRTRMLQQLLERQAECLYGYHMNEVDRLKQEGRSVNARSRIQSTQDLIRSLSIHTDRVSELLDESEKAYQFLMYGPAGIEGGSQSAAAG
jgi:hypothetical protein